MRFVLPLPAPDDTRFTQYKGRSAARSGDGRARHLTGKAIGTVVAFTDGPVTVHQGDVRECLRNLPAESVQVCVTSPPYWGLRDYGVDGQLGLEATPDEYVANMVAVFREVRRVLRKDATLWLNLGDAYAANAAHVPSGLKPKDLIGLPWRVAFALQADGWWLRSEITWAKRSPIPEPVRDRPTCATEKVFLLTRSPRYFYDREAVKEPSVSSHASGNGYGRSEQLSRGGRGQAHGWTKDDGKDGRNMRNFWLLGPDPYPGAHFATYPEALVVPCIKAGSREGDVVLDPFAGSGTTLAVARRLGRRAVGIELNPEYVELIKKRVSAAALPLMEML